MANKHVIYVRLIEGGQVWYPVEAKKTGQCAYEILSIKEFDPQDTSTLFEFIPGDVVFIKQEKFSNRLHNKEIAISLAKPSTHPDKDYLDFLFKAASENIETTNVEVTKYKRHIERIHQDAKQGKYFYPAIMALVEKLKK